MTRLRRSSPDERRMPDLEVVGGETRLNYRERTKTGKLRWKPWPDLVVPIFLLGGLLVWLSWVIAMAVTPGA